MPTPRRTLLVLVATLAIALVARSARALDYVLVRNAANPTTSVTRAEALDLFTGVSKQWGGAVVQTIIGDESSGDAAWLAARVFQSSVREMMTKIKQEIFRGEMKRPVVAHSAAECLAAVARTPGAVGVVDAETAKNLPSGVALLGLGGN